MDNGDKPGEPGALASRLARASGKRPTLSSDTADLPNAAKPMASRKLGILAAVKIASATGILW